MEFRDLRSKSIEQYLNEVLGLGTVGSKDEIQGPLAVVGRCTVAISDSLAQLSADIGQAQNVLGARLEKLSAEIEKGSKVASELTATLVWWTKALVVVTAIYAAIAGAMLYVTASGSESQVPTQNSVLNEPASQAPEPQTETQLPTKPRAQ